MATIPLAALHIQTPQPPDALSQYAKVQQLQNMQQQQRMGAQQIEASQQENQIRQQQISDQQAMTAAMHEWDGKDVNAIVPLAVKHGASANAVMGLKSNILAQQEKYSTIAKNDAETGQNNLKTLQGTNDLIAGKLGAAIALPDEQLASGASAAIQEMANAKGPNGQPLMDPQHAQMATQLLQAGDPAKIRQGLQAMQKGYMGQNAQMESAQKAAQTAKDNADAAYKQAEVNQINKYGGMTPAAANARYEFIQQQKNLGKPVSAEDAAWAKGFEHEKTLVPVANFNMQNGGATGSAGQPSAIAQAIANGSMKWSDAVSARTPMSVKQAILSEVKQINPNFNSGDFAVEQKAKEVATSGTVGQQLLAIGTAREHMKLFSQLADALDNGDVQVLNKIGNSIGAQFGSDKATNLKIAAQAFGGEVGRAFDGAGVIGKEREEAAAAYANYLSKGQFKGAVQTVDKLLAGKQKAAHDWFDKASQAKPDFGDTAQSSSPGAVSPIATHRFNPATGQIEEIK